MKPLLLLLTPTPPSVVPENWSVLWCSLAPQPGMTMSHLCRALYSSEGIFYEGPVALSTILPLPDVLSGCQPEKALPFLSEEDAGTLYFPDIRIFRQCALEALRSHDPKKISPTLEHVWHQYLLLNGE